MIRKILRITHAYGFTVMLLCAGYSCYAQKTRLYANRENALQNSLLSADSSAVVYGVFSVKSDINAKLIAANNLGVSYVRDVQLLSRWNGVKSSNIDYWNTRKKKIILNINNDSTPAYFPKDLAAYKNKLRSFLDVYGDSIELAVIENEEMNTADGATGTLYHLGSMQDYINELSTAVKQCKKRGIPVTNGGLTSSCVTSLKHYYDVNNKKDSAAWLLQQMNGLSIDSMLWKRTDSLLNAYRDIPLTYVNLHWYEPAKGMTRMTDVLPVLCNYITQQTGKLVITNETGIKSDSSFVTMLIQQWDSIKPAYCIFFDGVGLNGGQPLTDEEGNLLPTGTAFRNFAAGAAACSRTISVTPAGFINACAGQNILLTASKGLTNYMWNTGDTTQNITVNTTGNYSVISHQKNCTAFSNYAEVLINTLPPKPIITSTPVTLLDLCASQKVQLMSSNALTYLWNSGDTTKNINVNVAGKYFVTISDFKGCKNTSNGTDVTFQNCNAPEKLHVTGPGINRVTLRWDTVACATGYQIQYRIKGLIPWTSIQVVNSAADVITLYGLAPAIYEWRMLTYSRYAPDTIKSNYADGPLFNIIGKSVSLNAITERMNDADVKIFPVPAKDYINILLSHVNDDSKIRLTDVYGKTLWQSDKLTNINVHIPVSGLASGVYILIVEDKKNRKAFKILKQQ